MGTPHDPEAGAQMVRAPRRGVLARFGGGGILRRCPLRQQNGKK
jgi:hypothetical protein